MNIEYGGEYRELVLREVRPTRRAGTATYSDDDFVTLLVDRDITRVLGIRPPGFLLPDPDPLEPTHGAYVDASDTRLKDALDSPALLDKTLAVARAVAARRPVPGFDALLAQSPPATANGAR